MDLQDEEMVVYAEASGSGSPTSQRGRQGGMSKSAQKKAAKQVFLDFTATASIADGDFVARLVWRR